MLLLSSLKRHIRTFASLAIRSIRKLVAQRGQNRIDGSKSLRELLCAGLVSDRDIYRYMNSLYEAGKFEELTAISQDTSLGLDEIRTFQLLRLHKSNHVREINASWIERALATPDSHFLKKPLLNSALEYLVRVEDVAQVRDVLRSTRKAQFNLVPYPTLRGVGNLFAKHHRLQDLRELLARQDYSGADRRLYFLEMQVIAGERNAAEVKAWRKLLYRVLEEYPWVDKEDKSIFRTLVSDPLTRLVAQESADYLAIRYDNERRERLRDMLFKAVRDRRALSLIRLGDGESYAFAAPLIAGIDASVFEADNRRRERIWWSTELPPEQALRVKADVRRAIENADVLGVPSVYRAIRDLGQCGRKLERNSSLRGIGAVLYGLQSLPERPERVFTEERCHRVIFDRDFLEQISLLASRVIVVSCWSSEELKLTLHAPVSYVTVSPHARVKHLVASDGPRLTLAENYSAIAEELRAASGPGVCVLVAAGILGKVLIESARSAGAVAIDIGAVADYLAGYKTRSVADLL